MLIIYALIAVFLWFGQEFLLFPVLTNKVFSGKGSEPTVPSDGRFFIKTDDGQQLEVRTTFGQLAVQTNSYIGLIFHGNGETIDTGNYLPFFARHQIPAFTLDYRGYGNSTGWPSEENLLRDAQTFWQAVQARTGISADKAIILGNSIGSGPASYLASKIAPHSLILIAGFASLHEVLADIPSYLPFRWLLRYRFPNTEYLRQLRSRCVILAHGMEDTTIKFRHLEMLQDSVTHSGVASVVTLTDRFASHNNIYYSIEAALDLNLDRCLKMDGSR